MNPEFATGFADTPRRRRIRGWPDTEPKGYPVTIVSRRTRTKWTGMNGRPQLDVTIMDFLLDLERNNRREWFQEHKARYEMEFRDPALAFIAAFAPLLAAVSPHFRADARKVGGSLFRIHRDTRFSRDKTPYKTHCGIQFRHERGKDVHCPGYYLHLAPEEAFVGLGIWHPEKDTLKACRDAVVADPDGWRLASRGKRFRARYALAGDSLVRAPKGYDPEHPYLEDLRRKDFMAVARLDPAEPFESGFASRLQSLLERGEPLMRFLCGATGVDY